MAASVSRIGSGAMVMGKGNLVKEGLRGDSSLHYFKQPTHPSGAKNALTRPIGKTSKYLISQPVLRSDRAQSDMLDYYRGIGDAFLY